MKKVIFMLLSFLGCRNEILASDVGKTRMHIYSIENRLMTADSSRKHIENYEVKYRENDSLKEIFTTEIKLGEKIRFETNKGQHPYLRVEGVIETESIESLKLNIYVEYESYGFKFKNKILYDKIITPISIRKFGKVFHPIGVVVKVQRIR